MSYYQALNSTDTQDMFTLFRFANTVSGGILTPVLLLVIYFVIVLGGASMGKPFYRSATLGGFICSVLAILLVLMNLLNVYYMYFCFLMTGLALIWTRLAEAYS